MAGRESHDAPGGLRAVLADGCGLIGDFGRFGGRRLVATVALMIAGGMLEGVGLALLVPIVTLLAPQAGGHWHEVVAHGLARLGLAGRTEQLAAVLVAFCLLVALRAAVLTARDRMSFDLKLGYVDHRRVAIVRDLARARWAALARLRHARIGHILSSEIGRLDFACSIMIQMAASGVMLAVQTALMIALSPLVAALALGCALLGLVALVPLSRRAADVGTLVSQFQFRVAGEAAQFLGGLKIAVAHDMADAFVARIEADGAAVRARRDRHQRFQSRVSVASASMSSLIGAIVVFAAVAMGVGVASLIAALVVLARMTGPVRALQMNAQQLFTVLPAFAALRALREDLGEAAAVASDRATAVPRGGIRFDRVGFRYPDASAPVFAGLDLAIASGEVVGLSGPSGTGKTTFVDLLTGLLDPGEGGIAIGGDTPDGDGWAALGPDTIAEWRRRLAYVAQDSYLINDSIRQNLSWGGAVPPEADLWHALAQAGAADLVAAMAGGLDTVVDERGTRLSGGERQRIAIARAILRRPELLILDEATNAMDVATERVVIDNLRRTLPGAMILLIAHRQETLAACDRIISLAELARPEASSL